MSKFNPLQATASELQQLLAEGKASSVDLVQTYLGQVSKYNASLRAVIQVAPEALLLERAQALDAERQQSRLRGPLHGIPILIKDNIDTHPALGLGTTCGSFALMHAKPKANSPLVQQLIDAGAIVLGKANLGNCLPCGYSAVGGQTQSPYVKEPFTWTEKYGAHSNSGGSSSGSAVAVAAGFAPLSVGTETCGSIVMPGTRAALFTMKPTIGLISTEGIMPASYFSDTAGPMAKCAQDLADLLQVMVDPKNSDHIPKSGYRSCLSKSWAGIRVGCLAPEDWPQNSHITGPDPAFDAEQHAAVKAAYDKIAQEPWSANVQSPVTLVSTNELDLNGESALNGLWKGNLDRLMTEHLSTYESTAVHSLQDIVAFNESYKFTQLPPDIDQKYFLDSLDSVWSAEKSAEALAHCREVGRVKGIDHTLEKYNIDVILGPADSDLVVILAASGYPAITLPLTTYSANGRPYGLVAIASQFREDLLIQVASAWEATFTKRPVPHGALIQED